MPIAVMGYPLIVNILLGIASVRGCYYSALNLENPADYYYRYCKIGVSIRALTSHP